MSRVLTSSSRMRPRFRTLVLLLSLVLAVATSAESRRRAVRSGSSDCTFQLSTAYADPVPDIGMVRGQVRVTPSSATCTSWNAFSDVDWILVETDATTAYLTVLPNSTTTARSAGVRVAGIDFQLTQQEQQEGPISPPADGNMLTNGTFNTDLNGWGWLARFPNGTGDATWTSLDANGSTMSGSMRLRDDLASGPAYQQLQCINVSGAATFDYGAAVRAASRSAARAVLALVEYDTPDCAGNYTPYSTRTITVTQAGTWQRVAYSASTSPNARSVSLIIAAWARESGFQEVWFDDVFLRPRQ